MRKVFMCSLCHKGIVGGGLYLDNQAVTYRTQKLTVSEKYKNLILPLKEIKGICGHTVFRDSHAFLCSDWFYSCHYERYTDAHGNGG